MLRASRVTIGLITEDMRIANQIISEARDRGINIVMARSLSELPLNVKSIILNKVKASNLLGNFIYIEDATSLKTLIDRAYEVANGKHVVKSVIASIDPGEKRIGCAYFAEELLLRTSTYSCVDRLVIDLDDFFKAHEQCKKFLLIGNGRNEHILQYLKERYQPMGIKVIEVSEERSSQRDIFVKDITGDEAAAIRIFAKVWGRISILGDG